jgi:hypothetical protein
LVLVVRLSQWLAGLEHLETMVLILSLAQLPQQEAVVVVTTQPWRRLEKQAARVAAAEVQGIVAVLGVQARQTKATLVVQAR